MQFHVIFLVDRVKLILKLYKDQQSKKSQGILEDEPGGKICSTRNQSCESLWLRHVGRRLSTA